jgi:L-alanine-DL-glutamate epimerase-like enolase superfamily enzyme
LDGLARIAGVPVHAFVGGGAGKRACVLETDVTIGIGTPDTMAARAREWVERGFRILKVKVGRNVDADAAALEAIGRAAPGATLRVDANAGFSAKEALALARACERLGLDVQCWEQPCAPDDLDAMAELSAALKQPVIADESVRSLADLYHVRKYNAADGVNLKIGKLGGLLAAFRVGCRARELGMKIMVGGMVETRLGMTAGAHLACALQGVDFVDLDTAWLLAGDPYRGGYVADGPRYVIPDAPGFDVSWAERERVL